MTAYSSTFRVATSGQTLVLASVKDPAGTTIPVFSDTALTTAVTLPFSFSADTSFYSAWSGVQATVVVQQPDGTPLGADGSYTFPLHRVPGTVLTPKPTVDQMIVDEAAANGTFVAVVNEALYADASQTGIDPTGATTSDFTALITAANSATGGRGRIKLIPNSHYKMPASGSGSQWDLTALSGITFEGPQDSTPRLNPSAIVEFQRTDANPCIKLWSSDSIGFKGAEFRQAQALYSGTMFDILNSTGADPSAINLEHVRLNASSAPLSTLVGITHSQGLSFDGVEFAGGLHQLIGQRNPAGTGYTGATYSYNTTLIKPIFGGAASGGTNILNPGDSWVILAPLFEPSTTGAANFIGNDGTYMNSSGLVIIAPEAADYTSGAAVFDLGAARGFNILSPNFEGSGATVAIKFAKNPVGPSQPGAGAIMGGRLGGATTGIDFTTADTALGIDIANVDMQSTTTPLANYTGINQAIVVRDCLGQYSAAVNYDPVVRGFANGAQFGPSATGSAFDSSGNLAFQTNRTITVPSSMVVGGGGIGFMGATVKARQTVTGSKGGNAALASLITALATFGLITDSTT